MASVPALLRRVRIARREAKRPPTGGRFERYEAAYETILTELQSLAGEQAVEEFTEWMIAWTERNERLPSPERVRERARRDLATRGIDVPEGSPLSPVPE